MRLHPVTVAISCLFCLTGSIFAFQAGTNVAAFSNGAAVVEFSSQYDPHRYAAINVIDGGGRVWCSQKGAPLPQSLVIELSQKYQLRSIAVDDSGAQAANQEGGYPGIAARLVEFWLSNASSKDGFQKIGSIEVPRKGHNEYRLPQPATGRWVKIVVRSNYGNADYTEIGNVEANGDPVGPAPPAPSITGSYDTNYGALYLTNDKGRIFGCYPGMAGRVAGATDGRMLNFEWRQGTRVGTASMVLAADGSTLNGFWYEGGPWQGNWYGHRTSDKAETCPQRSDVSSSLEATGRAVLYGIHFDTDSAKLRPDSAPALNEVLSAMKARPALNLRVEGHTDSTNIDAYNLDLSRRRAQAVTAWLTAQGIAAGRLSSAGFGKTKPVADNNTAQGRALNRRVEIVAQ